MNNLDSFCLKPSDLILLEPIVKKIFLIQFMSNY